MTYRAYNHRKDLAAVKRIWKECGWVDDEADAAHLAHFFKEGEALVATIDGEAECCVHSSTGTVQYQDESLTLGAITAVTTSHISRKLGFAGQLTAQMLANQAESGSQVSALGMFEQGFYDKVGFGSGSYENWVSFDPATLLVNHSFRPPKRLTTKDYQSIHAALNHRLLHHGAVCLDSEELSRAELCWTEKPFGLGYFDGPNGSLSHFIWGEMKGEYGPYNIRVRAYQNTDQLMELLALIKSLGDQVSQIGMLEFGEFQLQDLLKQPFRNRRLSAKGALEQTFRSAAFWQLRILDLETCLAKTRLCTPELNFNLSLTDPVENYLEGKRQWNGLSGNYVIHLGEKSSAERGSDVTLPTLTASVNAFSRMWFGVRPATHLAITDQLQADNDLLKSLDASLRLPKPHFGWDF